MFAAGLLLVERANVDILMYVLVFLCLRVVCNTRPLVRFIGYSMILVPSVLKLLPIFSLGVILKERRGPGRFSASQCRRRSF